MEKSVELDVSVEISLAVGRRVSFERSTTLKARRLEQLVSRQLWFGSNLRPASFCLLPVNDLLPFRANPTPLKRIIGLAYGEDIVCGYARKTDGMKTVWKSERGYIQVVHEFMAKRGQYGLTRRHCFFIGVRVQSRIFGSSIW